MFRSWDSSSEVRDYDRAASRFFGEDSGWRGVDEKPARICRIVAGAGTGKTTKLLDLLTDVKSQTGCSPTEIGFTSLTKAARSEAVARASQAWGCKPEILMKYGWFRTAHSICYRQLGAAGIRGDNLISGGKDDAAWLSDRLGASLSSEFDADTETMRVVGLCARGRAISQSLGMWSLARSRMESMGVIYDEFSRVLYDTQIDHDPQPFDFHASIVMAYERAKMLDSRVDYNDLLSMYAGIKFSLDGKPKECEPRGDVPGSVVCWAFDEAQDSSALVDAVLRRLTSGVSVRNAWIAGDDMQSIFSFTGSSSKHFMSWPVDEEYVLDQSWRCPAVVADVGERCLLRMKSGYWDRGIKPAEHEGSVTRVRSFEEAAEMISVEESTLVLSRCNYVAHKWLEILRSRGIPAASIKAKTDTKETRVAKCLWSLEHGEGVDSNEFALVVEAIPSRAGIKRGVKKLWSDGESSKWGVVFMEDLEEIGFSVDLVSSISSGEWANLVDTEKTIAWRAAAVAHGPDVASNPRILAGTIHSAKGMGADHVILSEETTDRIAKASELSDDSHDEECRVAYVAVTRAKRRLTIVSCHSSDSPSMRLPC